MHRPISRPGLWQGILGRSRQALVHHHRKGVATWTSLGATFNSLPKHWDLREETAAAPRAGLFLVPELDSSAGFRLAQERALREARDFAEAAIAAPAGPEVVALFDKLSDTLCRVADLSDCVRNVHPDPQYVQAAEEVCYAVGTAVETLNTDVRLAGSLRRLLERPPAAAGLDPESRCVAQLLMFDFVQSGIHLGPADRQRFVRLNEELLVLGSQFMQGAQAPVAIEKDQVPKQVADSLGGGGGGQLTVGSPMADSSSDLTRQFAYQIYYHPNPAQQKLLQRVLSARHQLSNLVGFPTFAHRTLKGTMAKTPEAVADFLAQAATAIRPKADREYQLVSEVKREFGQDKGRPPMAWDMLYYSNLAKMRACNVHPDQLAPYFSLGACMEGLSTLFTELYGVELARAQLLAGEAWSPDVHKLAVVHQTEGVLGYIYCDFYERPGKPYGCCHYTVRGGRQLDHGGYQLPVVTLHLCLAPPTALAPSLLSHGMVENLFHEMGHAMHSMLARTRYQHVTGTRCAMDFAEVPSVLMEHFANDYRVLLRFARHYQTGETLPPDLFQRLTQSKRMFLASETQTQIWYSVLDQRLHQSDGHTLTAQQLSQVQSEYSSVPLVANTAWHLRFSHLIGYGAKYYSYVMSKAVASLIWRKVFAENPLDRSAGERYRRQLLAPGGSVEPDQLVANMLGEKPTMAQLVQSLVDDLD